MYMYYDVCVVMSICMLAMYDAYMSNTYHEQHTSTCIAHTCLQLKRPTYVGIMHKLYNMYD